MDVNPYASPQTPLEKLPPRFSMSAIIGLICVGIFGEAILGANTNIINAAVGPQYFVDVMRWSPGPMLGTRIVLQGALEGAVYGAIYSILFVGLLWAVSQRRCFFWTAVKYAILTLLMVLLLWIIGGMMAIGFAVSLPDAGDSFLPGNQIPWRTSLGYAWVAGSIFVSVNGALIAVIIAAYLFARRDAVRSSVEREVA